MVKLLFLLIVFSSCTISRYYKTKDLKKNFSSYEKQFRKTLSKLKKDLSFQKKILSEIKIYEVGEKQINDLKVNFNAGVSLKKKVENQERLYLLRVSVLDLKGERILSTEARYLDIEKFKNFIINHNEVVNGLLNKYKITRERFFNTLKQQNLKLVKTKDIKHQFSSYNSKFIKAYKKVKNSIQKFKVEVSSSKHGKKRIILKEVEILDSILTVLDQSNKKVGSIVNQFNKRFGKQKELIHGPKSPTYKSLEKIKKEVLELNQLIKKFNKQSVKINELMDR